MNYHLITSGAKIDQKNKIYLGIWCDEIKKKIRLKKEIDKNYLVGIKKKERVIIEKKILIYEKILFSKIVNILNIAHGSNYSQNYYNYIIGKWLRRYIMAFLNRFFSIEKVLRIKKINNIHLQIYKKFYPPLDSYNAIEYFSDSQINDHIYKNAINIFSKENKVNIHVNKINNPIIKKINTKRNFLIRLLNAINDFSQRIFSKFDKYFVQNSYLPIYKEFLLNLYFLQFPKINKPLKKRIKKKVNHKLRNKLKNLLIKDKELNQNLELKFLSENIFDFMPTSYLENFRSIKKMIKTSTWPKKPKLIFTSNQFDTDEYFKIYLAEQKQNNNVIYLIGQHGARYNFLKEIFTQEIDIADKILVWGNYITNKKFLRGNILKSKKIKNNSNGKILIVCRAINYRYEFYDQTYFFYNNIYKKINFLRKFNKNFVYENFFIRLGKSIEKFGFEEDKKIKHYFPKIFIEKDNSILESYKVSKLVIHFYFATTFFECISQNIPSIMFLNKDELNQFNNNIKKTIKDLEKNNLVFFSIEKMYEFIKINNKNIEKWWLSEKIQNCVYEFSTNFCKGSDFNQIVKVIKSIKIQK